jgi:riboflavin synthase
MFTGIVQAVGTVRTVSPKGGDVELTIDAGTLGLEGVCVGDSISVNGCCLTATSIEGSCFTTDVSRETLSVTTLGDHREGARVNLEKALCAGQALGGHYVTGHIDGIATVVALEDDGRSHRVTFEVSSELARYIARKGSVAIDGVSLTVNDVDGRRFGVNLIPHTLTVTTLGAFRFGTLVNVEVDIIARYLERLLSQTMPREISA